MRRVGIWLIVIGTAVSLSSCVTRNGAQTASAPVSGAGAPPRRVAPATAVSATGVVLIKRGTGTSTNSGPMSVSRAGDAFELEPTEGRDLSYFANGSMSKDRLEDAMGRALIMQPEVSFDQDQINILRTLLR
ncbi:MAG: hypothetical protein ABSG59_21955 [Verrucomicrobiota bacterium]|jgi:hypothetical protein